MSKRREKDGAAGSQRVGEEATRQRPVVKRIDELSPADVVDIASKTGATTTTHDDLQKVEWFQQGAVLRINRGRYKHASLSTTERSRDDQLSYDRRSNLDNAAVVVVGSRV